MASLLEFDFREPGTHTICMIRKFRKGECKRCIEICIPKNKIIKPISETKKKEITNKPPQPTAKITPDTNILQEKTVTVSPNPSSADWNIGLETVVKGDAAIKLYNLNGKILQSYTKTFQAGHNDFKQPASNLAAGTYILEISKGQFTVTKKLIRE